MTAFQKGIFTFGLCMGLVYFFTWYTPDMTLVYPDNCVFVIDKLFSDSVQLEIKFFIDELYKKNKHPSGLLSKIESHFPAIKSIVIDMHNAKFLNFTIQSYQPLFLLNNEHVVCQYGNIFSRNIFSEKSLGILENISFDGLLIPKTIDLLIVFFHALTNSIVKDFSIRWVDKHTIWLDKKHGQDLSLLVGYDKVPTLQDIAECQNLRGQILNIACQDKRGKLSKNNNGKWVCDLRFDRQIILFSTNKGG